MPVAAESVGRFPRGHTVRAIAAAVLVALTLLLGDLALASDASDALSTAEQVKPAPSADEKAVEAVVNDLGAADFETRRAASDKLKAFGPDVVPLLQKYREHDDPEVRARINGVVRSFEFMQRGAIVTRVNPNSRAEQLDIRMGDVIVKINDSDIAHHTDVAKAAEGVPVTAYYFWRAGKLHTLKVPNETLGFFISNWDIAKGGNDHARGMTALGESKPDLDEAYRRLRAAHQLGMDDKYSLALLAGLAARALDHQYALATYRVARLRPTDCSLSHNGATRKYGLPLPIDGPYSAWLLEQRAQQPFSPALHHEVEDWFSRFGRNGPLTEELLAKPWPQGNMSETHRYYHELTQMNLANHQRRFNDVFALWEDRARRTDLDYRPHLVLRAATYTGKPAKAVEVMSELLRETKDDGARIPHGAWSAFALAAALGDDASANAFLAGLDKLPQHVVDMLPTLSSVSGLNHPAAAKRLRTWLAKRPRPAAPGPLEQIALAQLIADPASTQKDFDDILFGNAPVKGRLAYDITVLNGLLRFGLFDQATAWVDAMKPVHNSGFGLPPVNRAMALVQFSKQFERQLAGGWKDARGLLAVRPGKEPGTHYAIRYDGQVFRLLEDGEQALHLKGLPQPPAPVTFSYDHLCVSPTMVCVSFPFGRVSLEHSIFNQPELFYVLDDKALKWFPLQEWKSPIDFGNRTDLQNNLRSRYVTHNYPALPGGFPRRVETAPGNFSWFEGDLLIHYDARTDRLTDLSAEIGRKAGREGPAKVYRQFPGIENHRFIFSDSGVWTFDPVTGSLTRVSLGLKDENVMTVPLRQSSYGKRPDDTVLIGVAPQQGGQIFAVHPQTLKSTLTGGFNGLGPEDWYGAHVSKILDAQDVIYLHWLAKQEKR